MEIIDKKPHLSVQILKVTAIKKRKKPHNLKTVRGFCGMTNYLSKFLPKLSDLLKPIRKLPRKNIKFEWTEESQKISN